jgi:replication initiation and membrane attachment protein
MNRYLFQASSRLTSEDQLHLSLLYQPIMGALASSLITLLYQRINHDHLRAHMKESELCDLAGCRPNELNESMERLEAIGLLTHYQVDTESLYQLNKPFTALAFFAQSSLRHQLFASVSEETYQFLLTRFQLPQTPKQAKDISKRFDEVYQANLYDSPTSSSLRYEAVSSIQLSSNFDINALIQHINPMYRPERITKELIDELASVFQVYDLSYEQLAKVYLFSLDDTTQTFDVKKVAKAAKDVYGFQTSTKVVPTGSAPSSEPLLRQLQSMTTKELLEQLSSTAAAPTELEIARKLVSINKLPTEIVNYMMYFVLHRTKGKMPSYNYFAKIANEWGRNKLATIDQVDKYIKSQEEQSGIAWLSELRQEQATSDASATASQSKKQATLSIDDVRARFSKL